MSGQPSRLERDPSNLAELLIRFGQNLQSDIWTAIPGIVVSYDVNAQTCEVRPALTAPLYDNAGNRSEIEIPVLLDVPVFFPGGGGYTMTFPVAAGDECLVVFASRCIDLWWQKGGVQAQNELRMHDLSDGFAFVGFRSQARMLSPAPSATSLQLRSDDGNTKVDVAGGVITVVADTVNVEAGTTASVTAPSIQLSNGGTLEKLVKESFITTFNNHVHTDPVSGSTGVPTVPSTTDLTTITEAQ